ncbi:GTP cyclohydrolase II [Dickeya dadantii]|uniref:GTP cyclohydrolase II n=1 Tax=Dickeya dadantii TaxID=204038 RepID=UPI000981D9DC|nr:GTP cyclohydrolase II [Dickeya dadantii]OOC14401.1 GTP cyclohydrolase II [Dickeya dadantii]
MSDSHQAAHEVLVASKVQIPITIGDWSDNGAQFYGFENLVDGKEHIAIVFGDVENKNHVLVRMHSECLTGDVFGSLRCDCGPQLHESLKSLSASGGVLLYLRQEGRGIGLINKLKAYELQRKGMNTYEANNELGFPDDLRNYESAAQMLKALNVTSISLITNNPDKAKQLRAYGITVVEMKNTGCHSNENNLDYLKAKKEHTHHTLSI